MERRPHGQVRVLRVLCSHSLEGRCHSCRSRSWSRATMAVCHGSRRGTNFLFVASRVLLHMRNRSAQCLRFFGLRFWAEAVVLGRAADCDLAWNLCPRFSSRGAVEGRLSKPLRPLRFSSPEECQDDMQSYGTGWLHWSGRILTS